MKFKRESYFFLTFSSTPWKGVISLILCVSFSFYPSSPWSCIQPPSNIMSMKVSLKSVLPECPMVNFPNVNKAVFEHSLLTQNIKIVSHQFYYHYNYRT